MLEHQVLGVPPGKTRRQLVASYEPDRWIYALKLVRYLVEQKGFANVGIVDVEAEDEE
jgi:hypothetical protein